jgi:hypothetical protein
MLNAHAINHTNPVVESEPAWFGMAIPECASDGCEAAVAVDGDHCEGCSAELLDINRQVRLIEAGQAAAPAGALL